MVKIENVSGTPWAVSSFDIDNGRIVFDNGDVVELPSKSSTISIPPGVEIREGLEVSAIEVSTVENDSAIVSRVDLVLSNRLVKLKSLFLSKAKNGDDDTNDFLTLRTNDGEVTVYLLRPLERDLRDELASGYAFTHSTVDTSKVKVIAFSRSISGIDKEHNIIQFDNGTYIFLSNDDVETKWEFSKKFLFARPEVMLGEDSAKGLGEKTVSSSRIEFVSGSYAVPLTVVSKPKNGACRADTLLWETKTVNM